jgi:hypothetical protein
MLKSKLPDLGFQLQQTGPNDFAATGHSISVNVAYDAASSQATVTLLKKMGLVHFASDADVYAQIDAKIKEALAP